MSKRQEREKIVAKKRAKGKLRKSHMFGKKDPWPSNPMPNKFMTGETP